VRELMVQTLRAVVDAATFNTGCAYRSTAKRPGYILQIVSRYEGYFDVSERRCGGWGGHWTGLDGRASRLRLLAIADRC